MGRNLELAFCVSGNISISTHTLLAGRDNGGRCTAFRDWHFYSHAPCGTWLIRGRRIHFRFRIPTRRHLRDVTIYLWKYMNVLRFLLTRPLRNVTVFFVSSASVLTFLLTRPLRDVTFSDCRNMYILLNFYSHAPYGTWPPSLSSVYTPVEFLLTRPLRDVTAYAIAASDLLCYFYSHAPCGTWRSGGERMKPIDNFYSHAPCGTWLGKHGMSIMHCRFLLTRPLRDVTLPFIVDLWGETISTHTPLAGRDKKQRRFETALLNFYSHAPCGTWRMGNSARTEYTEFLLTRPLRDVTFRLPEFQKETQISTHTPLAGRDLAA